MTEQEPAGVSYFIMLKIFKPQSKSSGNLRDDLKNLEPQSKSFVDEARKKIASYSQISIDNYLENIGIVVATTPKQEFEKLYQVSLGWKTKTVNNINKGPFQVSDWVMSGKPKVPAGLEDYVAGIELNRKVYLTD